jgi:hypothetical protein
MIPFDQILHSVFFIVTVMVVWFKTNAFVEYVSFFHINKFFYIDDYRKKSDEDPLVDYPMYLLVHRTSFFTKLISCPICLSIWFSLGAIVFFEMPLVNFGIIEVTTLFVYFILCKVMET